MNVIEIGDEVLLKDGSLHVVKNILYQLDHRAELIHQEDLVFSDADNCGNYRVGPGDVIYNSSTGKYDIITDIQIVTKRGRYQNGMNYTLIRGENLDRFRKNYYAKWIVLKEKANAAQKELEEYEKNMKNPMNI